MSNKAKAQASAQRKPGTQACSFRNSKPVSPCRSSLEITRPAKLEGFPNPTSLPTAPHTHTHMLVPCSPDWELWELPLTSSHREVKLQRRPQDCPSCPLPKLLQAMSVSSPLVVAGLKPARGGLEFSYLEAGVAGRDT